MPELPEVEVVRRGLDDHVVGRQVETADFIGARVVRRYEPGGVDLADRLRGNVVHAAERRGKYLWLAMEAPDGHRQGLVIHLGMSGQLLVEAASAPRETHLHAIFDFADQGPQLRFVDQRTFGAITLADLVPDVQAADVVPDVQVPEVQSADVVPDVQMPDVYGPDIERRQVAAPVLSSVPHVWGVPETISHIAPDPLEPAFDERGVVARLKSRHTAVKRSLLDQGLISGIGNIYADEALWRAQVHGEREAAGLSKPALGRLIGHARVVMLEALAGGGTSFDALYVNVNGASGFFDRSLNVYGRAGRPCPRCGALIRREAFMNRSSYSCPRCQPRPRTPAKPSQAATG